jgi:hypothetical protein
MTGPGAERAARVASPSPSVPPAGDPTPMPPHIQEAERRSGNRARHTGVRWGLRVLVVGGLAGAAWLLTGASAQAADRADGPDGSLLGSVVGFDAIAPVSGLLQAAAQPLEHARPAYHEHDVVADLLDVPRQVLTRPAKTHVRVAHHKPRTTVDVPRDVDEVVDEVAAPIRPTGEAAPDPEFPVEESPQLVADEPVALPQEDEKSAPQETEPAISRAPIRKAPAAGRSAVVPVKHGKTSSAPSAHRHHRTAHAVIAAPATEPRESTPGSDGPAAPLRLHLGDVSGTPTTGSGTPTEGGSAAFLPAAIASSTMAGHSAAVASDVEARRHDAEAPTVSPD